MQNIINISQRSSHKTRSNAKFKYSRYLPFELENCEKLLWANHIMRDTGTEMNT